MTVNSNDIHKNCKVKEKEWFQILAILISSLSSISIGLMISWTSPFMPKIVEDKKNYDITEEQASFFSVINIIGQIVLSPTLVPVINTIGRKNGLLLSSVPYIISWLIKAFTTNLWALYFARLVGGCGDAFVFTCLPVYIGEISTPKVRGLWGNTFVCSLYFGQFLITLLGSYFSVSNTSFIALTIPVSLLIFFPFMPESPYFYISKGKHEDAKASLKRLRRKEDVEDEFLMIKGAVERQLSESGSWKDLLAASSNRRAFFVASFLRCSQLTGGIMTFAAYTKFIFQRSGANIDPNVASILYTAVSAALHTCASIGSDKLGRRKSYISSAFLCGIVLLLLGLFFMVDQYYQQVQLDKIKWFPLAGMLMYLVCCSFGLGTVPVLMLGELFSSSIKGKGVAIVASLFGLTAVLVNNIFYYLNSYTGLCGPFFFFSACNFLSAVVSFYIVPETKNKSLEEIQQALRKSK